MRNKRFAVILAAIIASLTVTSFFTYAQFRTAFETRQVEVRSLGDDEICIIQWKSTSALRDLNTYGLEVELVPVVTETFKNADLLYALHDPSEINTGALALVQEKGGKSLRIFWAGNTASQLFLRSGIQVSVDVLGGYVTRTVIVANPYYIDPQNDTWEAAFQKVLSYFTDSMRPAMAASRQIRGSSASAADKGGKPGENGSNPAVAAILAELGYEIPVEEEEPEIKEEQETQPDNEQESQQETTQPEPSLPEDPVPSEPAVTEPSSEAGITEQPTEGNQDLLDNGTTAAPADDMEAANTL